ncbi:MAG: pyridoxal phosphate-dependent aminotransferase [Bacteriovorax sp.]
MTSLSSQAFGLENKFPADAPLMDQCDLRIGEPKISPFPFDIFNSLHLHKNINTYYPSHGDPALREMIIKKYYEDQTIDNIGITHGTMGALDFIFRSALDRETEILIPDPGFPPYTRLAEFSGAKVKKYFLNLAFLSDTSINWDHVESLISDKTKLILINSPHNPTGKVLTEKDFICLQNLLNDHPHISFLLDEVYRELIYDDRTHFDFSPFIERGYIVGSFSKMYPLQGARIGWVLTSAGNLKKLSPYFNNATGAMSSFGQEIVKILLSREMSFRSNYKKAVIETRKILDKHHVDYINPEGAFFTFIKYDKSGSEVVDELAQMGVGVVPGSVFGDSGEHYIRASFAQPESILQKGFTLIAKHWNKLHPRTLH